MTKKFDIAVLELVENAANSVRVKPMNLGAVGGQNGGAGGPPGGFIGWLPQSRVAYDESELATYATNPSGFNPPSGWSLLDNLNHIRARLHTVETSGILTVDDWDGSPTIHPTNHITFSGATVTNLGGGHALIVVGSGGGGGLDTAAGDARYLKLDTTNDPLTRQLSIINNHDNNGGVYIQSSGDAYTADIEQLSYNGEVVTSPTLFLYRGAGDASNVDYSSYLLSLMEDNANYPAPNEEAGALEYVLNGNRMIRMNPRATTNPYMLNCLTLPLLSSHVLSIQHSDNEIFWITASGHAYDVEGKLVAEAPLGGLSYVRNTGAWVTTSGLNINGAPNRVVLTDTNGKLFTPLWLGWTNSDTHEAVEFGVNRPNKIAHAGKIGYETFGNDYLFIVGAGSGVFASNRNVKILDNLYVDSNLFVNGGQQLFAAKQVTNGDSHDHIGGDGNPITETALSLTDVTTANASTSAHGLVVKATAPAANVLNVVGIANGETIYANKSIFDGTNPAALGTAAPGTSLVAAHRDHVHTLPTSSSIMGAFTNGATAGAGATISSCPWKTTADAATNSMPWPETCTATTLSVRISNTQPNTGTLVATLIVNNVASALVLTIAANSAQGTYSVTGSIAITANDILRWDIKNNASATSAAITGITMLVTKPTT